MWWAGLLGPLVCMWPPLIRSIDRSVGYVLCAIDRFSAITILRVIVDTIRWREGFTDSRTHIRFAFYTTLRTSYRVRTRLEFVHCVNTVFWRRAGVSESGIGVGCGWCSIHRESTWWPRGMCRKYVGQDKRVEHARAEGIETEI